MIFIIGLSSKKIKSLMTKEEKNLIIKSSICDINNELKEILGLFKDCIEKKDLDKISELDYEVYKIIKTRDAVEEMRDAASLEWVQHSYRGKVKQPCQLCGNSRSEEKFIIVNRINSNKLSVGSRCIFKFPKMDTKLHGIPITQVAKLSKDNPEKLKKIVKFNELYGSATDIFMHWKNKYNEFNIIFPKSYDDEFNSMLKQGRKIYHSYINNKINYDKMKSFKTIMDNFEYLYKNCRKFYNDNKDDKYVCTKKIARLLEDNDLKTTLTYIQEKGKITKDIAKYVYHIEFVNRFKTQIQNMFNKYNIVLIDLNSQFINFSYEYKGFEPIFLENSLKNFTYRFSDIFYGINSFNQSDIFNGLTIKNNYDNVYNFLGILEDILRGTGYYFNINEDLYEKQAVELTRGGSKSFAVLDLKHILRSYSEVLHINRVKSKSILLNYINRIDEWINESDKEKYDIGNIAEVWAK